MRNDPWTRREPVRDESWEDVYRAAGVDTGMDGDRAVDGPVEAPRTSVSGTATPGNDRYDPSLDTFRFRQSPRQRVRDEFQYGSVFSW